MHYNARLMTRHFIAIVCVLMAAAVACRRHTTESAIPATTSAAAPTQTVAATSTQARTGGTTYALQWVTNNAPSTMHGGTAIPVQVTVKNTGDWPWPDPKTANPVDPTGAYAIRLGYSWHKGANDTSDAAAARGDLAAPVPPGATATFTINVTPPAQPGEYQLEFDLVEELVTWFSAHGTQKLTIPVKVL